MEITVNNIPIKVIDENEINYKVFKLWNVSISKYGYYWRITISL